MVGTTCTPASEEMQSAWAEGGRASPKGRQGHSKQLQKSPPVYNLGSAWPFEFTIAHPAVTSNAPPS